MLPGLTSFTPFAQKVLWPRTRDALPVLAGMKSTRLLPASATSKLPCESSAMDCGNASEVAEASGNDPLFRSLVANPCWPIWRNAAAPDTAVGAYTMIRLSPGTTAYTFPAASTATPVGPARDEVEGITGRMRVVNFGWPQT